MSRKRKAPVVSSVVRVNRSSDEDSDDGEEEDAEYGGRGLSSRVSLAAKPERKSVFKLFTRNCMILRIENRPCSPALPFKIREVCVLHFHFRPAGFYCNSALHRFRPTLPPAKQANRNLILKAISEAQDSITKTTAFPSSTFTNKVYRSRRRSRPPASPPTLPQCRRGKRFLLRLVHAGPAARR